MAAAGLALAPDPTTWLCTKEGCTVLLIQPQSGFAVELPVLSDGWFRFGRFVPGRHNMPHTSSCTYTVSRSGAIRWQHWPELSIWRAVLLSDHPRISMFNELGDELVHNLWRIRYNALRGAECVTIFVMDSGVDEVVLQLGTSSIRHFKQNGEPSESTVEKLYTGVPLGDIVLSLVVEGGSATGEGSTSTPHSRAAVVCYSLGGAETLLVYWLVCGLAGCSVRSCW